MDTQEMCLVEFSQNGPIHNDGKPVVVLAKVTPKKNSAEILEPLELRGIVVRLQGAVSDWLPVSGPVRQLSSAEYQVITQPYYDAKWAFADAGLPEITIDQRDLFPTNWEIIARYHTRIPELLQLLKRLEGCGTAEEKRLMLMKFMSEEKLD